MITTRQKSQNLFKAHILWHRAACAGTNLRSVLFCFSKESNQIKSRKQNVSLSVSTALPLHVASGDFFFFLLTSKLGHIQRGNTLQTKTGIWVSAFRPLCAPSPDSALVFLVCLFYGNNNIVWLMMVMLLPLCCRDLFSNTFGLKSTEEFLGLTSAVYTLTVCGLLRNNISKPLLAYYLKFFNVYF